LLTNHLPRVSPSDYGFWERCKVVEFPLSYVARDPQAPNERRSDPKLEGTLRAEYSGILAWLVRGCLIYQRDGLRAPAAVTEVTRTYQRDQDIFADFLDAVCDIGSTYSVQASTIYHRFNEWFKEHQDEEGITQTRFGRLFREKFQKRPGRGNVYFYHGVRLKPVP
jgi:putative DNA primase/helicase